MQLTSGNPETATMIPPSATGRIEKPPKLVFLESIRGIAALAVVFHHLKLAYLIPILNTQPQLRKLVRVVDYFSNGPLAVQVFFVLSGFVLSLGFVRTGNRQSLVSSAIRRYFRLVVPVFISVMLSWVVMKCGFYFNLKDTSVIPVRYDHFYHGLEPLSSMNLFTAAKDGLIDIFFAGNCRFNFPLWTMPIELAGSFLVYSVLALFGLIPRRGLIYGCLLLLSNKFNAGFICGIIFCEIYVQREKVAKHFRAPVWAGLLLMALGGIVGIGAFGCMASWDRSVGSWLECFWGQNIAAILVVGGAVISLDLQKLLEMKPLAFLGKVSFSLYVVHDIVNISVGNAIYVGMRNALWSHAASAATASVAAVAVSLLAAWGLYYVADLQGIRLGKFVEKRLFSSR